MKTSTPPPLLVKTVLRTPHSTLCTRAALLDTAIVTLACLTFLALCLYQLDLPGLYPDEAFDVIPAMQLLLGHPVELQRNIGLHIFGLDLPLMSSSDYQGVTSTYMALPFFALGGVNVISLRLMTVSVGLLGVILTYFLAKSWFGSGVARLAVLLIAVSPAWVFWSRLGVYVVAQIMPIAVGALLAFTVWARRRPLGARNGLLYLGTFLLGLGLTTKLLFLWFIVAVGVTALILWGRPLWENRRAWLKERGLWLRRAFIAGMAFCIGASPFLIYNVLSGGTFNLLRHTISGPGSTSSGVSNSALIRNLWTEADAFKVLLDGGYFWFQGVAGAIYANPLTPALFAISALGLVALILWERGSGKPAWHSSLQTGTVVLGVALALALVLATGILEGTSASLLAFLTGLLGVAGAFLTIRSAMRFDKVLPGAGWLLLTITTIAGALWWFGGAGRPEGMARGALLGLWPIDGAGLLFWTAGAGIVVLLGIDKQPVRYQRVIAAALSLIGLIVGQSAVTVSGLWSTHLIVLLPLPQIVIAAFLLMLGTRLAQVVGRGLDQRLRPMLAIAPAVLLAAILIFFDLKVAYQYQRDLAITGGSSTFSDAIYSLSDYLDKHVTDQKVVALDWGFKRPIQLLTLDHINPLDAYGYEEPPTQATKDGVSALVDEPNTLFLFHTKEAGVAYPRFELFTEAAHAAGKQPVLERTFYQRDGIPVYEIYSVR